MAFAWVPQLPVKRLTAGAGVLLFCSLLLRAQPQNPGGAELQLRSVRHWALGETLRIAIEVSGEFTYRYDRLSNPERIYFDIPNCKPALSRQRVHTIQVADKLLKQIRVSETQPGVTRVVLDLEQPVDFRAAQLVNPDRLVVEIRARSRPGEDKPPQSKPPEAKPSSQAGPGAAKLPSTDQPIAEAAALRPPVGEAQPPSGATPSPKKETAQEPAPPTPTDLPGVPLPARKARSASMLRALGLKLTRVVIDPGHGGSDTGTIGPGGLMEKDLVLDIALRLGALIEEQLGAEVIYTRSTDVTVPLEDRTALANEKKADLFISVHANAGVRTASGAETYYLNFTTSRAALDVAARENASSRRSIHELQSLLEKIALQDKVVESREFATRVQSALVREIARSNPAARDRGVRQAPFVVLIGATMPSILIEVGFLSNPREEKLLNTSKYRQQIAAGLYNGIARYASTLSRFEVAEKQP